MESNEGLAQNVRCKECGSSELSSLQYILSYDPSTAKFSNYKCYAYHCTNCNESYVYDQEGAVIVCPVCVSSNLQEIDDNNWQCHDCAAHFIIKERV